MAKSATNKKSSKVPDAATYSTRLSAEQGRWVEEAARIVGDSPSKFIRDAVLRRALEVVNSQGQNAVALRRIAEQFANRVLSPTVRLHLEAPDGTRFEREINKEEFEAFLPDEEPEDIARAASYWHYERGRGTDRLNDPQSSMDLAERTKLLDVSFLDQDKDEIRKFRKVFSQAGTELIELVLRELEAGIQQEPEFVPQIDPARLMAGDDADGV